MFKPYAKFAINSKGRLHKDSDSNRNVFQRDKDRIIHSASFRRLEYKTQVFVNSLGDHFRTRLTHSLEVAQIAREISTRLGVNSDLSEVVALSHDIGHPPFGHAGCDILDELMQDFGGFDHNQFVLKLLTEIEEKYINFKGLNLTYESLEGIIKHNGPILDAKGYLQQFNYEFNLDLHLYPSLEAQIASLSDDIAYNNHDIDDGFRAGILKIEDFKDSELLYEAFSQIKFLSPNAPRSVFIHESLMI